MTNFRLCITGGSGFIGTEAVKYAIKRKLSVVNFDIKAPKILEHQSYWKYVDIRDYLSFSEELKEFEPTHILHLAANTGMDIKNESFFDVNTKGVENLINASFSLLELKRIIFTSSLLVCENGYVPEKDTEYCPPNLYGESKVVGEKSVRGNNLKCDWVIVRPTSIWGPWFEHSYLAFFKMIDRGWFVQPGKNPIIKPISFVGNCVYMMMEILFYEGIEVSHQTYYLGDYPEFSVQQWADLIHSHLGKQGKTVVLPVFLLKLLAFAGDILKIMGYLEPPLTSFRLKNMLTGSQYPIQKTQSIVGELPFSIEDGIKETLTWMYQMKLLKNIPSSK